MSIYRLTQGRHGQYLYNTNDKYIGRSLELYGEWSEAEVDLFRQIVRPGDTVVEAGANIGTHSVYLSRTVGDAGQVLAFEPARHTFQLLCANLALNECFNARPLPQAIGAQDGQAAFMKLDPRFPNNFGAAALCIGADGDGVEQVEVRAIDSLHLPRLDFIKSDIEGHEVALLQGAVQTIKRNRPILYLEVGFPTLPTGNRDELVGFLTPLGYQCYYYIAPMFNPANFRLAKEDEFGASSVDLICVPSEKAAVDGLTMAAVGDTAIFKTPDGLHYGVLPWQGARFHYL